MVWVFIYLIVVNFDDIDKKNGGISGKDLFWNKIKTELDETRLERVYFKWCKRIIMQ